MGPADIAKSLAFFILAGLCEIGGGYLIWLWLRDGKSAWFFLSGALVLILYGIIPTFQPANFGRVYAAYGGIFIILSILWGWQIDNIAPDRFDVIGGCLALIGVVIIMYWPRG
jgi:small multidrug resistance family-3 protein